MLAPGSRSQVPPDTVPLTRPLHLGVTGLVGMRDLRHLTSVSSCVRRDGAAHAPSLQDPRRLSEETRVRNDASYNPPPLPSWGHGRSREAPGLGGVGFRSENAGAGTFPVLLTEAQLRQGSVDRGYPTRPEARSGPSGPPTLKGCTAGG